MTKKQFLLKLNNRLTLLGKHRKSEILNHYRAVIDQSMANGNTEESSVEAMGNINYLSGLILRKEKKFPIVPILFAVFSVIFTIIKIALALICIAACIILAGLVFMVVLNLANTALDTFLPSTYLITANIMGALFKAGACLVLLSAIVILFLIILAFLKLVIKLVIVIIRIVKDIIYMIQSTKLMKETFSIEAIN